MDRDEQAMMYGLFFRIYMYNEWAGEYGAMVKANQELRRIRDLGGLSVADINQLEREGRQAFARIIQLMEETPERRP